MNWFIKCIVGSAVALSGFVIVGFIVNPLSVFTCGLLFFSGCGIIVSVAPKEIEDE